MAATEIRTGLPSESGHWYTSSGESAYTIRGKNGNMRPVDLRDARKLNLFPSVTTILRVAAQPGLENWKIEQAILSALTLERLPKEKENETQFAKRALADSREQARKAAALGTLLHEQIERSFSGPCEPDWWPFVKPVRDWLAQQFGDVEWSAERSFACDAGYGGKVDLSARAPAIVVDFKSKDFIDPETIRAYDEHGVQLAAYAHGLGLDFDVIPQRWNVFVSTREPGLIKPVQWDPATYTRHLNMFSALLNYWMCDKAYCPGVNT